LLAVNSPPTSRRTVDATPKSNSADSNEDRSKARLHYICDFSRRRHRHTVRFASPRTPEAVEFATSPRERSVNSPPRRRDAERKTENHRTLESAEGAEVTCVSSGDDAAGRKRSRSGKNSLPPPLPHSPKLIWSFRTLRLSVSAVGLQDARLLAQATFVINRGEIRSPESPSTDRPHGECAAEFRDGLAG
jgi:hypothetical protein